MATSASYPKAHLLARVSLIAVLCSGCAARAGGATPAPTLPVIESLEPSSGPAGAAYPLRITILGTGFADSGNVVRFAAVAVPVLAEESSTRIVFLAPKERPSTGEAPPFVLPAGDYDVTVTTPAGTSAPATFTLTRGE